MMSRARGINRRGARVAGVAVLAAVMVLVLHTGSGSVSAQAETETRRINVNQCRTLTSGRTLCEQATGVSHTTRGPSGVTVITVNAQLCQQLKDAGGSVLIDGCVRSHETKVFRRGEEQVVHIGTKTELTAGGETCRIRTVYQVANGVVRHVDSDERCEPVS